MLKVLLCLAGTGSTLLEALRNPLTREALRRTLKYVEPTDFVSALMYDEPWLALNSLEDKLLCLWQKELAAIIANPTMYGIHGHLPSMPNRHLLGLRASATGRGDVWLVVAQCWQRALMPPELLMQVIDCCVRQSWSPLKTRARG